MSDGRYAALRAARVRGLGGGGKSKREERFELDMLDDLLRSVLLRSQWPRDRSLDDVRDASLRVIESQQNGNNYDNEKKGFISSRYFRKA